MILGLALLARDPDRRGDLGWLLIVLLAVSPLPALYHFILLLVPVALILPGGAYAPWATGLIVLYALVELPVFHWDADFFPRAWLLLALFLYVGWRGLRALRPRAALALLIFVVAVSAARAWRGSVAYQQESTRVATRAIADPDNIYSSSPAIAGGRMLYEKIDQERYLLVTREALRSVNSLSTAKLSTRHCRNPASLSISNWPPTGIPVSALSIRKRTPW